MPDSLAIHDEEYQRLNAICTRLLRESNANVVFLVDKNGQLISAAGNLEDLDTISLASLTAGNVAATGGLAKLIGEKDFSTLFHEGEKDNIHISIIADKVILVVIFDEKSSLGLVRLRVKKGSAEMENVLSSISKKMQELSPLVDITDDDIEKLFNM